MRDRSDEPAETFSRSAPSPSSEHGKPTRIAKNLLYSWAGQFVFMVAGFVLPRSTDAHLGQAALGVWDFGWQIAGQFGLAQLGINASVNRFVARYREQRDVAGLRRMTSTVLLVQCLVALFLLSLAGVLAWFAPWLIKSELASQIAATRWVVFFLGASLAVKIACNTFDGVLTGCHRWDLHNLVESGSYVVIVAGMLAAQVLGHGLRAMAVIYFVGSVLGELVRISVAHRVCPELEVRPRHVRLSEARTLFAFGGKIFVAALSGRLMYQMNGIQIARALGPALLALYSRPLALIMLVSTFVGKLAHMLTPLASQMDASGKREDVRGLLFSATRSSAYMALPPVLFLAIMGGPLLHLWMGERYSVGAGLLAILALGHLPGLVHRPLGSILVGMNAHGVYAWGGLVAAAVSVALCHVSLNVLNAGLPGAALAVVVPQIFAFSVWMPLRGCSILGVPFRRYLLASWSRPLLLALPFGVLLGVLRLSLAPLPALLAGLVLGGAFLAVVYWRFVLPSAVKSALRRRAGFAAAGSPAADPREGSPDHGDIL